MVRNRFSGSPKNLFPYFSITSFHCESQDEQTVFLSLFVSAKQYPTRKFYCLVSYVYCLKTYQKTVRSLCSR